MQLTAFNKKACLSLLIIGLTLTAVQPLGAQTTAARITLSEKHVSLKYIFNRISKMAGISILYDEKAIANITVANINVTSVSLQQAMQECLKGTNLDFEIKSNSIVVRKKEPVSASVVQQPNDFFISGKVMDESGTPLAGVSIYVRGTDMALSTVEGGLFSMNGVPGTGIIVFSSIGYQTLELPYDHNPEFNVRLKKKVTQLAEVAVEVNNGYQVIPKERTTGSFDVIDNKLFNRSVSSNLLDHLDGVASGVLFDNRGNDPNGSLTFRGNTQTFYIRGVATVQSSNAPLVVVDGFPYNGYAPYQQNINNLNPNDIESVTILKDAAAASIWGARAGNGVVVITTKSGKYNQRPQVNFNSSVTFTGKPLLFTQRILSTSDFIDIEKNLYPQGAYDNVFDPTQNQGRPPTQVIQLLHDVDQGLITQAEADAQIAALSKTDVRHDALKYFYRTGIDQQYNLSVSGGSPASKYFLDGGYDHLTAPDYSFQDRYSLNSNYTFKPADGLELSFPLQFTINQTGTNNGSWSSYGMAPYTKLTDATGHPINVNFTNGYNQDFIQKADALGLYDMSYNPIEQFHAAQYQHTNSLLASIGPDIRYSLHNGLNFDLKYQYSRTIRQGRTYQSDSLFNIKNMINNYTQIDPTGGLSFPINRGGTLQTDNYDETDNNIRATVGYNRLLGNYHRINIIAGYEHNESKIIRDYNGWYGYNPRTGTVQTTVDYISYFPQLNNTLSGSPYSFSSPVYPLQSGTTTSFLAYISSFANASYTFKERYVLTASGRIDQANLFGVSTNDKKKILWHSGLAWKLNQEAFYKVKWLPTLQLRATFGYQGNTPAVGVPSQTTISYNPGNANSSGLPYAQLNNIPNPNLRWEKVAQTNFGVDFALKKNILSGTAEYYTKKATDLLAPFPSDPTTGVTSRYSNVADISGRGIDITLNSRNFDSRHFKWYSRLLLSHNTDKLTKYFETTTAYQILSFQANSSAPSSPSGVEGRAVYGVYSLKSAGLDAAGNPQGYDSLGKASADYNQLVNFTPINKLDYHGSANPTWFGNFVNDFSYDAFTLSVNISYKAGYYFHAQSVNYSNMSYGGPALYDGTSDYSKRWQHPGDEKKTYVPSMPTLNNMNYYRDLFYQFSSDLVQKGDNLRLRDISLKYTIDTGNRKSSPFANLEVYGYYLANTLLWKANKIGIDPDYTTQHQAKSYSIGLRATFK